MEGRARHLLDYWAVFRRRRWVLLFAVSTATTLALVGSILSTRLYRATATLQIERLNPDILSIKDLARVDYNWAAYADYYQTQYKILASEAVARGAVEALNLTAHPLFAPQQPAGSLLQKVRSLLPGGAARSRPADPALAAARAVLARLQVTPIRGSQLVQVSWVASDPELAAQVANALAKAYIEFNMGLQYESSGDASGFLEQQIADLKRELNQLETTLQDYGESKNIVSIDDANNVTMRALADIAQRRTECQTALARAEATYKAVLASPEEVLAEAQNPGLINRLREDYARYEAEYSEKSRLFKADWPELQTLTSKMEQAKQRLEEGIRTTASHATLSAESEYRKAARELANLTGLLRDQEDAAQQLKRDAVEFANLQSDAKKKRDSLNSLIARKNDMALSTRLKDVKASLSNIRVVESAQAPEAPFRPNTRLNLLVGLIAGLGLGACAAFLLEALDNTVRSAVDVERASSLPALALVPRHGPSASTGRARPAAPAEVESIDLVAYRAGQAAATEAYRGLRTALLLSNPGGAPRQILFTSALPEEGKSATAVNLAVVFAQLGRRVLLVDADLRRPRLHRIFGLDNGGGLSTYLSGMEADPRRLSRATEVEHLELMSSGPIPPNPSELLNSRQFAQMGPRFLEQGYDHVIYDAPPGLAVSDPIVIASVVDAVVVVARSGRTPRQSLRLVVEKLSQAGARPVGVVLNDMDVHARGYGYDAYYAQHDPSAEVAPAERGGRRRRAGIV